MLSVPKMNSGLVVKEAWDYCHYSHKVLDYLLQIMHNSPHLLDILFPKGDNNPKQCEHIAIILIAKNCPDSMTGLMSITPF